MPSPARIVTALSLFVIVLFLNFRINMVKCNCKINKANKKLKREVIGMNANALRILSAVIAGILIVAVMAACGAVEKPDSLAPDKGTESPVISDTLPDNTLPETEPILPPADITTEPEDAPQPDTTPATEATAPETTPEQTSSEENISEVATTAEPEESGINREKIVEIATAQLGVPFKQGGQSPDEGFDSTGFTYYCVNEAGTEFPRRLSDQLESGDMVPYSELKPGDIVYFSAEEGGEASFCGVYVGGGLIIYSPVPDDFVKTANITTNYWTTHFVTGLRIK